MLWMPAEWGLEGRGEFRVAAAREWTWAAPNANRRVGKLVPVSLDLPFLFIEHWAITWWCWIPNYCPVFLKRGFARQGKGGKSNFMGFSATSRFLFGISIQSQSIPKLWRDKMGKHHIPFQQKGTAWCAFFKWVTGGVLLLFSWAICVPLPSLL